MPRNSRLVPCILFLSVGCSAPFDPSGAHDPERIAQDDESVDTEAVVVDAKQPDLENGEGSTPAEDIECGEPGPFVASEREDSAEGSADVPITIRVCGRGRATTPTVIHSATIASLARPTAASNEGTTSWNQNERKVTAKHDETVVSATCPEPSNEKDSPMGSLLRSIASIAALIDAIPHVFE